MFKFRKKHNESKPDPEYIKNLDKYLNDYDDIYYDDNDDYEDNEKKKIVVPVVKGNITANEIRYYEQLLLYMVIDESESMYVNGLAEGVRKGINSDCQYIANRPINKGHYVQMALTFFNSELDMHPFQYVDDVDASSYAISGNQAYLFDAVIESCKNMIYQYDSLEYDAKLKGLMLIFIGSKKYGSAKYDVSDVQDYLKELENRNINYIVAATSDVDSKKLGKEFNIDPIITIDDASKLGIFMQYVTKHAIW